MKVKVSETTDIVLDYLVAKCEGRTKLHDFGSIVPWTSELAPDDGGGRRFCPSTKWEHGGPIIEREKLILGYIGEIWECRYFDEGKFRNCEYGPTPLIAAMRCFVASKLGDVVDVPDELMEVGK